MLNGYQQFDFIMFRPASEKAELKSGYSSYLISGGNLFYEIRFTELDPDSPATEYLVGIYNMKSGLPNRIRIVQLPNIWGEFLL